MVSIHEMARVSRPVFWWCEITNSCLEREEFALRAVGRHECEVVHLRFFDVPFQPRFLLHEFIVKLIGIPCERPRTVRTREIRMAQTLEVVMDQGRFSAARQVISWVLFATQFGTLGLLPLARGGATQNR